MRVVENSEAVVLLFFYFVFDFFQFMEVFIGAYGYRRIRIPMLAALALVPRF